jgi:ribonuclease-3
MQLRKKRTLRKPTSNSHPSAERIKELEQLQNILHLKILDIQLLDQAFTHRSFANESSFRHLDNERLEFLGDSVLGFLVAELLYTRFPEYPEGTLAKLKSKLVSGSVLSELCRSYNLMQYVRFGKGEKSSGMENPRVMENLMEALVGALYLDQGMESCRKFLIPQILKFIKNLDENDSVRDYKSLLQERSQKEFKKIPVYDLLEAVGPDHEKTFTIRVSLPNGIQAEASGRNKRAAEQSAAKKLLQEWKTK